MVALAAVLVAVAPPLTVAVPGFESVGIGAEKVPFYSDYVAQQLAQDDALKVTSHAEVQAMIGLERQKSLLGCASDSCTAELLGALGVDAIVVGSIAKLEGGIVVSLRIIDAGGKGQLAAFSEKVEREDALLDTLARAARTLATQARAATGRSGAAPGSIRSRWWIPAAIGAVALGGGVLCYGLALGNEHALRTAGPGVTDAQVSSLVGTGNTEQALAFALGAVGIAALLAAVGFIVFGGSP